MNVSSLESTSEVRYNSPSTNSKLTAESVNRIELEFAKSLRGTELKMDDGSVWGKIIDAELSGDSVVVVVEFENSEASFYPFRQIKRALGIKSDAVSLPVCPANVRID